MTKESPLCRFCGLPCTKLDPQGHCPLCSYQGERELLERRKRREETKE